MGPVLAFVRHGAPRKGESDPGLTSAGRRMAYETGEWLARHGLQPAFIRHTPTQRTRETAEELAYSFEGVRMSEGDVSPELIEDWQDLTERLGRGLGAGKAAILVGHHPTVGLLLDHYGPPPVRVPRMNLAVGMVLGLADGPGGPAWRIHAAWPGRPSF